MRVHLIFSSALALLFVFGVAWADPVPLAPPPSAPSVAQGAGAGSGGTLSSEVLRGVVMTRKDDYLRCYQDQLQLNQGLEGQFSVVVMVSGSQGDVMLAKVVDSTLNHRAVEGCVVKLIQGLQFPIPEDRRSVRFTYSFRFPPE